jgi:membrane-anchored mycosin MYCP
MDIRHGWVEKFHGDQLVVAESELAILQRMLHELHIAWASVDASPALKLARITGLAGVDDAVTALLDDPRIAPDLRRHRGDRESAHGQHCPVSGLALLIKGIQLRFAERYPGWQMRIGKNYRPSLVEGYPHIGGGGEGAPSPPTGPFTEAADVPHDNPEPGRGVRAGVLDTKLFRHETLDDHYVGRDDDLLDPGQDTFTEFEGHCTFVASCILRQAPHAQLYLRHVLDRQGDGSAWDSAVAIAEMAQAGLDVVNLSFGEFMTDDDAAPMVLAAAVRRFGPETVVVAAAGNNGDATRLLPGRVPPGVTAETKSYPAALPDVIGVGAIDEHGKLAPFTPRPAPWISLYTRGTDLNAAYLRGKVSVATGEVAADGAACTRQEEFHGAANWAGCSFAAGIVTGVIAAGVIPGRRSARDVLGGLLHPDPPGSGSRAIVASPPPLPSTPPR